MNTENNTKTKKKSNRKLKTAVSKMAQRIIAAIGAAFLPVASFQLAHGEAQQNPFIWLLVGSALAFSLPSLVKWVNGWSPSKYYVKAIGFAVLLEATMIFSGTAWLAYSGLVILIVINALSAWTLATKKIS
jgi:hypothetical protein